MYLISHRGNLNGIQKDMENEPEYISNAIRYEFKNIFRFISLLISWIESKTNKLDIINAKNIER